MTREHNRHIHLMVKMITLLHKLPKDRVESLILQFCQIKWDAFLEHVVSAKIHCWPKTRVSDEGLSNPGRQISYSNSPF